MLREVYNTDRESRDSKSGGVAKVSGVVSGYSGLFGTAVSSLDPRWIMIDAWIRQVKRAEDAYRRAIAEQSGAWQ
jgi:hypothetical protein